MHDEIEKQMIRLNRRKRLASLFRQLQFLNRRVFIINKRKHEIYSEVAELERVK